MQPMRTPRPPALLAALLAAALLGPASTARAQRNDADPVEELRQVLREPAPLDEAMRKARADALAKVSEKLRSLVDLSRAVTLTEWNYINPDLDAAKVDRDAFDRVAQRFLAELRRVLERGGPGQQIAAVALVGEMASKIPPSRTRTGEGVEARRLLVKQVVPELKKLTGAPDARVKAAVARSIGSFLANTRDVRAKADTKAMLAVLRELNATDDRLVRRAVARAINDPLQAFSDIDPVRTYFQRGGAEIQIVPLTPEDRAEIADDVLPIVFAGVGGSDPVVRRLSADSIRRFTQAMERETRPPPPPLTEDLETLQKQLRAMAPQLERLSEYADDLKRMLNDRDGVIRAQALRILEDMALIRSHAQIRRMRVVPEKKPEEGDEGLGRGPKVLFERTTPDLLRNLSNEDRRIRLQAVEVLENLGADAHGLTPHLVPRLGDGNLFVRWASARALAKIDKEPVPGAIGGLGRLLSDPDLSVRIAAAGALETFGPLAGPALDDLLRAVNTGDPDFRVAALFAIGSIGKDPARAVPAIAEGLTHPDPRVRRAAARTLGRFGADAERASAALRAALRDRDADVRRAASEALLNIPIR